MVPVRHSVTLVPVPEPAPGSHFPSCALEALLGIGESLAGNRTRGDALSNNISIVFHLIAFHLCRAGLGTLRAGVRDNPPRGRRQEPFSCPWAHIKDGVTRHRSLRRHSAMSRVGRAGVPRTAGDLLSHPSELRAHTKDPQPA